MGNPNPHFVQEVASGKNPLHTRLILSPTVRERQLSKCVLSRKFAHEQHRRLPPSCCPGLTNCLRDFNGLDRRNRWGYQREYCRRVVSLHGRCVCSEHEIIHDAQELNDAFSNRSATATLSPQRMTAKHSVQIRITPEMVGLVVKEPERNLRSLRD